MVTLDVLRYVVMAQALAMVCLYAYSLCVAIRLHRHHRQGVTHRLMMGRIFRLAGCLVALSTLAGDVYSRLGEPDLTHHSVVLALVCVLWLCAWNFLDRWRYEPPA